MTTLETGRYHLKLDQFENVLSSIAETFRRLPSLGKQLSLFGMFSPSSVEYPPRSGGIWM